MTAETAYHVIKALPKNEVPRLYKMLGFDFYEEEKIEKIKKPLITDEQATEFLLFRLKSKKK
ncbi:hypothetical protein [Tenacibaculum aiptasiae]|uniref:hypothetical protein n=1 Tax=Tenacibaculum aiptasiae TaxID=426481 RepID=UPI00232B0E27|nr:hypothetical protein [Tenacibaculum aiptasiae]